MATNDDLLDIAVEAATGAGTRLREVFRTGARVATKTDFHDPVTEHDLAAEEQIRAVIGKRAPGSVIVGEEGGTHPGSGEVTWYVDPIDGTANFAAGVAFFCVSIGAAVGGELVAGAIYDPVRDQLFTAGDGGARCDGVPLTSAGPRTDREALLLTSYPSAYDLAQQGEEALHRFGRLVTSFSAVRRPGSAALKLAHVAAGWAHACFGLGASPWDVAAGALLVRRAGGRYLGDPFTVGPYLATVGGFDLAGSALAELVPA
ncbi:inositol monophosphatase family protein [Nonomuraea sp. NPDC050310]|uniref:inositol monophosphatase family protein n=1 Tax=Nonomuraea sp. NPDC050310 TaxID=3154935 RepID=UPI0033F38AB0